MRVIYSPEAVADLEEIGDYIARDSGRHAANMVRLLRSKCHELARYSERFAIVGERGDRRIRRRPSGNYAIFYAARPGKFVEILRILHSARDHEPILFPED